jgi:hypothetical protein
MASEHRDPADSYLDAVARSGSATEHLMALDSLFASADSEEVRAAVHSRDIEALASALGTDVERLRSTGVSLGRLLAPIAWKHRLTLQNHEDISPGPDVDLSIGHDPLE